MAEASINEVVKKLTEISENIKKFAGTSASTYAAQQEKYRAEYESRAKQPPAKQQQDTNEFIKNLADSIFGRKSPSDLSSKEKQRYKKIGEILKPVFNAEGIIKAISKYTDNISETFEQQQREKLLKTSDKDASTKSTSRSKDTEKPKKQSWFESILSNIGPKLLGGAALLAIGMGIAHMVKGATLLANIDTKKIIAFSVAFGIMAWGVSKVLTSISKLSLSLLAGALAFGAIVLIVRKQVIPSLQELSNIKWDDIKGGVAALGIVMGTMITSLLALSSGGNLRSLIGKGGRTWGDVLKNAIATGAGIGAIYALVSILRYELVPALKELSEVKWDAVKGGLAAAGIALGGMTILTGAIAAILNDKSVVGFGKNLLTAVAAGGIVYGLIELTGELGKQMQSFQSFDWDKIKHNVEGAGMAVGGLTLLATGIAALLRVSGPLGWAAGALSVGALYAIIDNVGFLADGLAKYSAVDANKLKEVGDSLFPLSKGMLAFLGVFGVGGLAASVTNIVDSIMSIFNRDVVGVILKFESINDKKLTAVGESLTALAGGLNSVLSASKLSTADAKNSAKAVAEFLNTLAALKTSFPNNAFQIKLQGNIDENLIKTVDKLATDLRDINNISLNTTSAKITSVIEQINAKQIKLDGLSELQKIIKDLNTIEIDLLTEQRDILKDVNNTLRASNMHLQILAEQGLNTISTGTTKSYMREEKSFTREHYLQNTNLFKTTIK